jgi:hypothetical protein
MSAQELAPPANVVELRSSLAEHYGNPDFRACTSMGELVRESLETVRRNLKRATNAGPDSARDFAFKD